MKNLPPQLHFVPLLLGTLLVLAAVAWSARTAPHARAIAPSQSTAPAAQSSAAAPLLATTAPATRAAQRPLAPVAPGRAGMRAYIDPETGKLGAPPTEGAGLPGSDVIIDSGLGLVQQVLPNGSVMVDLKGQFQDYAIMEIDASGHRVVRCVQNPKRVQQNGVAPAAAPVER